MMEPKLSDEIVTHTAILKDAELTGLCLSMTTKPTTNTTATIITTAAVVAPIPEAVVHQFGEGLGETVAVQADLSWDKVYFE
jgi:hypothetical protein